MTMYEALRESIVTGVINIRQIGEIVDIVDPRVDQHVGPQNRALLNKARAAYNARSRDEENLE